MLYCIILKHVQKYRQTCCIILIGSISWLIEFFTLIRFQIFKSNWFQQFKLKCLISLKLTRPLNWPNNKWYNLYSVLVYNHNPIILYHHHIIPFNRTDHFHTSSCAAYTSPLFYWNCINCYELCQTHILYILLIMSTVDI